VQHAEWLRDLTGVSASLYVHVPFCKELCWYCACHTMAMNRLGTLDSYTRALLSELGTLAGAAPGLILEGVQWGGGTPSQLGAARLRVVGRRIASLFDRRCDAEVSLEIDPRHCDGELASAAAAIGVTRASRGVQDFDESVQAGINRRQSFAETRDAIGRLRAVGIGRFNVDLVYGLPNQILETLARSLDLALELGSDRFAVFGYAHLPWMKPHQRLIDEAALPGNALRAAMSALVAERLTTAGYRRIGLDHYARPDDRLARAAPDGTLHRTFQGYVTNPARYMAAVAEGGFATARGITLTRDDRLRGAIIERVMCENAVDVEAVCRDHRVDLEAFRALLAPDLDRLERDGLIRRTETQLTVTGAGRPFVRFVCAAFDRHYVMAEDRHSRGL
jgi:oxygen-independent coproporphyrinogen-3 oxidase